MISSAKKKLMTMAEIVHLWVFGHEMSDEMRIFLGHLSWSFFGGIIAAIIMCLVNILAGRWLGPLDYGKYNYLLSLATSSMFIFLLGNSFGGIRYISDEKYSNKKNSILTATLVMTIFQIIIFSLVIISLNTTFSHYLNLDVKVLYLVFFFGLVISFKELLDSFLRSLKFIRKQSLLKIVDATLVLTLFLFFFFYLKKEFLYLDYVYAFIFG